MNKQYYVFEMYQENKVMQGTFLALVKVGHQPATGFATEESAEAWLRGVKVRNTPYVILKTYSDGRIVF